MDKHWSSFTNALAIFLMRGNDFGSTASCVENDSGPAIFSSVGHLSGHGWGKCIMVAVRWFSYRARAGGLSGSQFPARTPRAVRTLLASRPILPKCPPGEERQTKLQSLETVFSSIGAASRTILDDPAKRWALIGGLSALALGVYAAKNGTRVAANVVEKNLGKPSLVRDTSRWNWKQAFVPMKNLIGRGEAAKSGGLMDKIVLEQVGGGEYYSGSLWEIGLVADCEIVSS